MTSRQGRGGGPAPELPAGPELFQAAFENAALGMSLVAPDLTIVAVNDYFLRILGYDRQRLVGRSMLEFIHPQEREACRTRLENMLRGRIDFSWDEQRYLNSDGNEVWVMASRSLMRDADGQPRYFISHLQDITIAKMAEAALDWELQVNSALARISHAVIGPKADQSRIAGLVLQHAQELTGSRYGYAGSIVPETRELESHTLSRIMDDGRCEVDLEGRRFTFPLGPDGHYSGLWGHGLNTGQGFFTNDPASHPSTKGVPKGHVPIERFLSVPAKIGEKLVGQIALANPPSDYTDRDLQAVGQLAELYALALMRQNSQTETARLEAQLRQAQKMEAMGTLAGGIAHDFNNILAAIFGFTEMARDELPLESGARDHLEQSLKAAQRAKDLVGQILVFSRRGEQEKKPLSPALVVKEALRLLRASLPATVDIQQEVTAQGAVLADPTQIHQVVMNLCTNAAQAMRPSGGMISVRLVDLDLPMSLATHLGRLSPGRYVRLTISDTGPGIDRAIIDRIFDPYFTTKGAGEGTGLGLSVVQGIVIQHGGRVRVESSPGRGASFEVYLPRLEIKTGAEEAELGPPPRGHERILFVDDEPVLVEVGTRILERLGYQVTGVSASSEALALFEANPQAFDAVITDLTMPLLTGVDLAKRMLGLRPDLPIILCTGFSDLITSEEARELGVGAFVMKPMNTRTIAGTLRQVLERE